MREDENFDKIIQQKFAEKEFVFNEENWEKVERKINSSRRVNKFFRWTTIFSIGLCCGIAVMIPFVIDNDKKNTTENAEIVSELKPKHEIAELVKKENVVGISQDGLGDESTEKHFSVSSKTPVKTDKSYQNKSVAIIEEDIKYKTGKVTTQAISNVDLPENENVNSLGSENKQSITKAQAFVRQAEVGKEAVLEQAAATGNSEKQLLIEALPKDSAQTKPDLQVNVFVHTDSSSSIHVSQNLSVQPQLPLLGLSTTNVVSIDAGVNCNLGWSYHDTIEACGFNPLFGIGFAHYFNAKWALNSGIQYGSMVNFNATKKEFSSTKYDFGYNLIDTVINTRSLYYAVLPLQLQYYFNNKNSVGIGGTISYLVNTKSDVAVYSKNSFGISGISTNKQFGFMSGFRQWDASVSLAYRRRITEKLTVGVLTNYGLFDIKSDAFFLKQKFERNIGLKLIVTYDLFQY